MVSRAIERHNKENKTPQITEILVHSGQHYDQNMSQEFFDQLHIPTPHYNLGVGSGPHGEMTGTMLPRIEKVLLDEKSDWVIVYGDTNTTLAGAMAAVKIHMPVAHVEAGLRSFNKQMPEEINRVLTDRISALLFCPTDTAVKNLEKAGIFQGVHKDGDVMYDAYLIYKDIASQKSTILKELKLEQKKYCLATIHRQENTDNATRLKSIFSAFEQISNDECPLVIPLHPRTQKALQSNRIRAEKNPYIRVIPPVSYLDMIALESNAQAILTDSGGIQKESFFAGVPCITLRDETEWVETIESGWNILAGADEQKIVDSFQKMEQSERPKSRNIYGDGNASQLTIEKLIAASPFDFKNWNPSSKM